MRVKTSTKDAKTFLDTNILVYGYDLSAGEKHERSKEIIKDLWNTGDGLISTQVAQEFFVTVTKKKKGQEKAATAISLSVYRCRSRYLYSLWR